MNDRNVQLEPLGPQRWAALEDLFERNDVRCFCRYWHFEGDGNAWQARIAHGADTNRQELRRALRDASPEMRGVVAVHQHLVVGWLKLAPARTMQKLYDQKLYRGLTCLQQHRETTVAVGCVLVDESWRRSGVARALIAAAGEVAKQDGASWIEAFPRRAELVSDAELWTGPARAFEAAGFRTVHDFRPYPVMRLGVE